MTWAKSALNARCRVCRRKGDGENMLLCDGCDKGHHLYCLKPQLKVRTLCFVLKYSSMFARVTKKIMK